MIEKGREREEQFNEKTTVPGKAVLLKLKLKVGVARA